MPKSVDSAAVLLKPSPAEQKILDEVNVARSQPRDCDGAHHFEATHKLTWNSQLAAAALAHSQDMATNGYLETSPHSGSDGSTPSGRVTKAGYAYSVTGENVAAGFLPAEVVDAWLKSPSHCENIMDPDYKEIGVSFVDKKGEKYDGFYTQEFGTKR